MPATQPSQPPKASSRRRKRRFTGQLTAVLVVILICGLAVGAYNRLTAPPAAQPNGGTAVGDLPDPLPLDNDLNILLMGVDERPHDVGRSDTLMVLHVDADNKRLFLLSLPRDTAVQLPGHGRQKINAAYVYGGVELLKQTVADLTGLKIDYFVKVNMDGFAGVIDALGGIDIDVKRAMSYNDTERNYLFKLDPGLQHLNGTQAMYYVRWRGDPRADLGRIERQQQFLSALALQKLNPGLLPRLPALIAKLRDCVTTDVPAFKQVGLGVTLFQSYNNGLSVSTMPGEAKYIDRVSYVVPDENKLHELIAGWNKTTTN